MADNAKPHPQAPRALVPVLTAAALLLPLAAAAVDPGWDTFTIPGTGSYATRYLPPDLELEEPVPAIVFLHGSGAYPHHYAEYVEEAARRAGCVLILPKSAVLSGWGSNDDPYIIDQSMGRVAEELPLDPWRTAVAGHSSGGAYAYWLAFRSEMRFSAVFTLSAPFLSISAVADPGHTAPVRMYYGTDDPNYFGGDHNAYVAQWLRLNVPWEEEILAGYGHNTWPDTVMENGFEFLVHKLIPHPIRPGGKQPEALTETTIELD